MSIQDEAIMDKGLTTMWTLFTCSFNWELLILKIKSLPRVIRAKLDFNRLSNYLPCDVSGNPFDKKLLFLVQ